MNLLCCTLGHGLASKQSWCRAGALVTSNARCHSHCTSMSVLHAQARWLFSSSLARVAAEQEMWKLLL